VSEALPLLRELALYNANESSADYMLAGEAIVALAKLGDEAFRPEIERIITNTKNPRLRIMGVEAFGIYQSPHSLSVLVDILRGVDPPPYLREEVMLAMARILGVENQFYPLLVRFREDETLAPTLAMDDAESACEFYRTNHSPWFQKRYPELAQSAAHARVFQSAVADWVRNPAATGNGAALSRWILELPSDLVEPISQMVLAEIVLDDDLQSFERLKLLIVHWASHELRLWTTTLKNARS
jgi:hypothetical protein